jgi:hypothetical protein
MVYRQPADSIIVYATSSGQVASDGTGRNGLFTSQLLHNLSDPNLDISEVFRRTGADVSELSSRQQIPAIYNQFFGIAFLSGQPGQTQAGVLQRQPFIPAQAQTRGSQNINTQFWSIGASIGSSFSFPLVSATVRATLAPLEYSFLELGFEYGTMSGANDIGYTSVYPFAHYAFFLPFNTSGGFYIGAGGGYMLSEFDFSANKVPFNIWTVNFVTGLNIANILDISYSLRTNFSISSHKAAIGYTYRFR